MNISSAILHIVPGRLAEAREALLKLSGLEIHAESPEGKMVVVLEDDDLESAARQICDPAWYARCRIGCHGLSVQ